MTNLALNTWYQNPFMSGSSFYYFTFLEETEPDRWRWIGKVVTCISQEQWVNLRKEDFFFNGQPIYEAADSATSSALDSLVLNAQALQDILFPPSV